MQRIPFQADQCDSSVERTHHADAFVFQYRKHLSIFLMLVLGIIPVNFVLGRPWNLLVILVWLIGLVGWYMVHGLRFRHHGRRFSYTISGVKYGPKYITDLETGAVMDAQEFIKDQSIPQGRILILGLVMPMVLLACMILCGITYIWLRVHLR